MYSKDQAVGRPRSGRIKHARARYGLSRRRLYEYAAEHAGLFKKTQAIYDLIGGGKIRAVKSDGRTLLATPIRCQSAGREVKAATESEAPTHEVADEKRRIPHRRHTMYRCDRMSTAAFALNRQLAQQGDELPDLGPVVFVAALHAQDGVSTISFGRREAHGGGEQRVFAGQTR